MVVLKQHKSKLGQLSLVLALLWVFACQPPPSEKVAEHDDTKTGIKDEQLISVQEAYKLLTTNNDTLLRVLEVSKADAFAQGHLPGALNIWRPDYESRNYPYSGMRANKQEFEALLSRLGISEQSHILLYDTKGNCDAIRLLWMLKLYGHEKAQLINGGKKAWTLAGLPLDTLATALPSPANYVFHKPENHQYLASFKEVQQAMTDTNFILLDTREPEEYAGLPYLNKGSAHPWKKGAFTYGRIPGAVHLNWSDAVDLNGDHCIKSLKDLRWNFEQAGIHPDKNIIVYCQSGVRSAHTTYILTEILGYPNVKNYDGSWIEWSYFYTTENKVAVERDVTEKQHTAQLLLLEQKLLAERNEIQ